MTLMALKPDKLNGQAIYRGVEDRGGVNHVNSLIVFKPEMVFGEAPIMAHADLVENAMRALITVSEQTADPVIKAQAVTFRGKLKQHQDFWMRRAAINERARVREQLRKLGFAQAAEAIARG